MVKRINVKKVRRATGIKEINPVLSKTTIEPIWGGYRVAVPLNLFGKIVSSLEFPVTIILYGVKDAWECLVWLWKTGGPYYYDFKKDDLNFEAVKKLYIEAEGE